MNIVSLRRTNEIAAYVRASMDRRGDRWTVETQLRKIRALAEAKDWRIVEVYEDNAVSATRSRRTDTRWAQMLRDAEDDRFSMVVAVDMDRLLRNTKDLNTLIDLGLRVVTVDGEIDLSTADGEFRATMLAAIARFETRRKAERQVRANERRRNEGQPTSTWKPFGWTREGTVIEAQAAAVRRAFAGFLGEPPLSIRRIQQDLNDAGHLTARGRPFSVDAVRYLLANPLYAGYIKHYESGELYPVQGPGFEPIVEESTWRAAVARLALNAKTSVSQGNQPAHLLSTIALCGRCGSTMASGASSHRRGIYKCWSCLRVSRQRDAVDAFVTEAVLTRLAATDVRRLLGENKERAERRQERLLERAALITRSQELTRLLGDVDQPVVQISAAIKEVNDRVAVIDEELLDRSLPAAAQLLSAADGARGTRRRRQWLEEAWADLDLDRRRLIIRDLVRVTIHPVPPGRVKFDPGLIEISARTDE